MEPLALLLLAQEKNSPAPELAAQDYIDPEKGVETEADALQGANDIVAEMLSDDAEIRKTLRSLLTRQGHLRSLAAVEEDRLSDLPADMAAAYESARSLLARTGNPQLADFELDAAYFAELLRLAEATGSDFIKGYVRTMIDSANLRAAVRTVRMGKDRDFMLTALVPGGFADRDILAAAAESGDGLAAVFASTCLEHAAALGAEAMKGGSLTDFELECDNAVSAYLSQAKTKPFGIEPAAEYLALLESEITAARMILTGRLAGIEPEVIRERLRDINA